MVARRILATPRCEPCAREIGSACERFDVEAEVEALVSPHADIDALDVWRELPSRPPEDAPLLELIGYLVRRWWRMLHTPTRVG